MLIFCDFIQVCVFTTITTLMIKEKYNYISNFVYSRVNVLLILG